MENRDGIIKKIKEKISNRRDEKSYIKQKMKQAAGDMHALKRKQEAYQNMEGARTSMGNNEEMNRIKNMNIKNSTIINAMKAAKKKAKEQIKNK